MERIWKIPFNKLWMGVVIYKHVVNMLIIGLALR